MNIADTLRGLLRRWYVVVPGIILAVAGGIGAFAAIAPGYERTATQLLLPGEGTVPPGVTNPYLYLGGLTQASDIVVRVMQGEEVAGQVAEQYPGTDIVVQRDPTVSGPVIQIVVTAKTDDSAADALDSLVSQTGAVLDDLQDQQRVSDDDRMTVTTLTQDSSSTLQQKTRLVMSAGVFGGILLLTIVLASLVDGLSRRPRRAGRQGSGPAPRRESGEQDDADAEVAPIDSDDGAYDHTAFASLEDEVRDAIGAGWSSHGGARGGERAI